MTILRDISFLWSMMHIVLIFLILFEPRYSWRVTLTAGFAGVGTLLAVNTLAMLWRGHGIIMTISFFTCTLPSLLLFFVLSKYRDGRFFFLFCLSDTICFWLLQLTNFLDRLTGDTYVTLLIGRLVVFPVVEYFFWRYLRRPYLELQSRLESGWWLFAAMGGTYYLLIMFTAVPVDTPMPDLQGIGQIVLVLLLMPLTYLTIFRSLWRQMQNAEGAWQMELQRRDYRSICRKMELMRINRHDMRHHLIILDGLLQQEDSEGARQYMQQLSGKLLSLNETVWCPNSAVNAVLRAYISQAEEAGCRVEAQVRIPAQLPYGEMDLCIILANTIENATHACRDIQDGTRWISLRLEMTDNRRLTLSICNACPAPVRFDAGGLPVVQVRDGHGLGLQSVRRAVERYNGFFRCHWESGQFSLQAVLFPPAKP